MLCQPRVGGSRTSAEIVSSVVSIVEAVVLAGSRQKSCASSLHARTLLLVHMQPCFYPGLHRQRVHSPTARHRSWENAAFPLHLRRGVLLHSRSHVCLAFRCARRLRPLAPCRRWLAGGCAAGPCMGCGGSCRRRGSTPRRPHAPRLSSRLERPLGRRPAPPRRCVSVRGLVPPMGAFVANCFVR